MYIDRLFCKNFRNYASLSLELSPTINLLVGPNGGGKTNILEAVSVLSDIRSFRNVHDSDVVQWGRNSYFCSASVQENNYRQFEIGCTLGEERVKKRAKIDGSEIKKVSDYFGKLLTVVFSPNDINILSGTPEGRRRFFDEILSRVDSAYFNSLSEFRKVLASRNSLLRNLHDGKRRSGVELDVWDDMYSQVSSCIIGKRLDFIQIFARIFTGYYLRMSGFEDPPGITYASSAGPPDRTEILKRLTGRRERDLALGSTSLGPQRDDYLFLHPNGRRFVQYASQGQKRAAVIALKISECSFIEESTGKKVIIMVDDIFSELDETRKRNMSHIVTGGNQVIFTMVSEGSAIDGFRIGRRFAVENGTVRDV